MSFGGWLPIAGWLTVLQAQSQMHWTLTDSKTDSNKGCRTKLQNTTFPFVIDEIPLPISRMLNFQNFFEACLGVWVTERTYHAMVQNEVERSHTEFRVTPLTTTDKETILSVGVLSTETTQGITIDTAAIAQDPLTCPGFAIAFDTLSEKGEQVSMQLKALFVPAAYVVPPASGIKPLPLPAAAEIDLIASGDVVQGLYLRDEGYSEAGATAGQFTYQPTRQTLEMTTYYKQSQ